MLYTLGPEYLAWAANFLTPGGLIRFTASHPEAASIMCTVEVVKYIVQCDIALLNLNVRVDQTWSDICRQHDYEGCVRWYMAHPHLQSLDRMRLLYADKFTDHVVQEYLQYLNYDHFNRLGVSRWDTGFSVYAFEARFALCLAANLRPDINFTTYIQPIYDSIWKGSEVKVRKPDDRYYFDIHTIKNTTPVVI